MMKARATLLICVLTVLSTGASAQEFQEGWETAQPGTYIPGDFIEGEEGVWFLGDSFTDEAGCGPTPHSAEAGLFGFDLELRLNSVESGTDCPDDVWAALSEFEDLNTGFSVPVEPGTILSFEETGELIDPGLRDGGLGCEFPPCFDNVSLILVDSNDNMLAYVLQRHPEAIPNLFDGDTDQHYREIFLDPNAGYYRRDLFEDFRTIPGFSGESTTIDYIEFRVDEHGWAVLDDLTIASGAPAEAIPVYRFFSTESGCHFFTADQSERRKLLEDHRSIWLPEGIAFYALPEGVDPNAVGVHRFWSPVSLSHLYTTDPDEIVDLLNEPGQEWVSEGIVFYVYPVDEHPPGTSPVHHFRDPVGPCDFFTISETEKDKLANDFPDIWTLQGIAWYAYPPQPGTGQ
jgi:hypothetical protein